jgi:hypothetical protein
MLDVQTLPSMNRLNTALTSLLLVLGEPTTIADDVKS